MRQSTVLLSVAKAQLMPAVLLALVSCVMTTKYAVEADRGETTKHVAKVHLRDGSVAIYRTGFSVVGQKIEGTYTRYDLGRFLTAALSDAPLPLDSVLGVVSYPRRLQVGPLVASAPAAGLVGACVAIILHGDLGGTGDCELPINHTSYGYDCKAPAVLLNVTAPEAGERSTEPGTGERR